MQYEQNKYLDMKRSKTILILIIITVFFGLGLRFFWKRNLKPAIIFKTKSATEKTIMVNTVATGKIIPDEEVVVRPNISGIIDQVFVKAGDTIKIGDRIARIKVIPTINNLQVAINRVASSKIELETQEKIFDRQEKLFKTGAISANDYDQSTARFKQAEQSYLSAQENYDIIKTGTAKGYSSQANTLVKATIGGVVLEVPVKKGLQVIQSNNFNSGTEIATIADISKMVFKGSIDESDIGKVKEGMSIEVTIGALPKLKLKAVLDYIAPKGIDSNGTVQFDIEGKISIPKNAVIRSGLSANASIILDKVENVLALNEALLQYDKKSKKPYVEVLIGEQEFERKDIELGLSDGISVEIKKGITLEDKIKDWNAVITHNKKKK